jgi:hypothetical protein
MDSTTKYRQPDPSRYEAAPPAGLYVILDEDEKLIGQVEVRDDGSISPATPELAKALGLIGQLKAEPDGWEGTGYLHCDWPATSFVLGVVSAWAGAVVDPATAWVYHVTDQ